MAEMRTPTDGVDVKGLDSDYLDCINDNLAALLRHHGAKDVRTPFACQWHMDFDEKNGDLPLPGLERVPVAGLIVEQTGLEFVAPTDQGGDPVATCAAAVARGQPVLAVGDAFMMPWQPYFGRQHMDHSFVVDGVSEDRELLHIADAYQNKTQWGEARPGTTWLPAMGLAPILESSDGWQGGHLFVVEQSDESPGEVDHRALVAANAKHVLDELREGRVLRRFSGFYAERADDLQAVRQFTLACWLVARARALHGLWLRDLSQRPEAVVDERTAADYDERVTQPWKRVTEFSYVMERRAGAGKAPPRSAFELLEGDVEAGEIAVAERLAELSG